MSDLSLEQKRAAVLRVLEKKKQSLSGDNEEYKKYTYDMFMHSTGIQPSEMQRFSEWVSRAKKAEVYTFEQPREAAQRTTVKLASQENDTQLLNFSSYNYLGLGYHPETIEAAKIAIERFGIGAASSPVISGTYSIHKQFEHLLLEFFDLPGRGISLFSSGYAVNLGVIQAYVKPGDYVLCDSSAHMSILEGAKLSGANILYFSHNDLEDLKQQLKQIQNGFSRILVCIEGVYSAEGDYGKVSDIVHIAKKFGAAVLVDEAHSVLLAGRNGKGVCEEQEILSEVDLYVMTFSKAFGGVGGALLAKNEITQYVNWYAKCRMFSCALPPGVTGGMLKALELSMGKEGEIRRERLYKNVTYFKSALNQKVNLGASSSWIVPIIFHNEGITLDLGSYLQEQGLDTSIMQFPAVPKNQARIRMFVTSEHTKEQLDTAAKIILKAAEKFGFKKNIGE